MEAYPGQMYILTPQKTHLYLKLNIEQHLSPFQGLGGNLKPFWVFFKEQDLPNVIYRIVQLWSVSHWWC